jgi:hypothetical protein
MNWELRHAVIAAMRQMGRQYTALEPMLETMTVPQLQDMLRLMRDTKEDESRRLQGRMSRMGIPRGMIR